MLDRFSGVAAATRRIVSWTSSGEQSTPSAAATAHASPTRRATIFRRPESSWSRPVRRPSSAVTGFTAAFRITLSQSAFRMSSVVRAGKPILRSAAASSSAAVGGVSGVKAPRITSPSPAWKTSPVSRSVAPLFETAPSTGCPPSASVSSLPSPFCRETRTGFGPRGASAAAAEAVSVAFAVTSAKSGAKPSHSVGDEAAGSRTSASVALTIRSPSLRSLRSRAPRATSATSYRAASLAAKTLPVAPAPKTRNRGEAIFGSVPARVPCRLPGRRRATTLRAAGVPRRFGPASPPPPGGPPPVSSPRPVGRGQSSSSSSRRVPAWESGTPR